MKIRHIVIYFIDSNKKFDILNFPIWISLMYKIQMHSNKNYLNAYFNHFLFQILAFFTNKILFREY